MTTPEGILDFIAELTWDDLPPQVRRQSKLCLLDLIGVGAGGAGTKLSRIIRDYSALDMGGALPMMFDGRGASVSGVALAGGMTIDALDGHDGFNPAKGHAGCGVLPALYGLAQELGDVSGQEFLLCLTLGYELACRTAMAQHASVPDYHTSGAWVAVAVAGLAARLMGLDRAQTAHAMGIAEYHGPRSQMMRCIDHPTMLKDGSGWGAMCGVSAARLAARGFTGAPALTLSTDHWRDLGDTWLICQQYFKPYPVCRWAQAPITAVLDLQKRHGFDSRAITGLHIVSFHESVRLGTKQVTTTEEAQYSTSFPCALALVHGTVLPEHVAEAAALRLPWRPETACYRTGSNRNGTRPTRQAKKIWKQNFLTMPARFSARRAVKRSTAPLRRWATPPAHSPCLIFWLNRSAERPHRADHQSDAVKLRAPRPPYRPRPAQRSPAPMGCQHLRRLNGP